MVCMSISRVQLDDCLVVLDGRLVLAQLGQAVAPVVVQAHGAWALLQGRRVVLTGGTKLAQLAEGIPSVAQSRQICWGSLQHPAGPCAALCLTELFVMILILWCDRGEVEHGFVLTGCCFCTKAMYDLRVWRKLAPRSLSVCMQVTYIKAACL